MAIVEPVASMGPRKRPQVTLPKPDRNIFQNMPAQIGAGKREHFKNMPGRLDLPSGTTWKNLPGRLNDEFSKNARDREGYRTLEIPPNYEMPKPQNMPLILGKEYERMPVSNASRSGDFIMPAWESTPGIADRLVGRTPTAPEFTPEPVQPTKGRQLASAAIAVKDYLSRIDPDVDRFGPYIKGSGEMYGPSESLPIPGSPNRKRLNDAIAEIQRRAAIDQLAMPQTRLQGSGQDMASALNDRGMSQYPLDIPVQRRETDYPLDIPMGFYPREDRGRVQRELDLMALTDGLQNQRDLDAQFLGIDMTPKKQVVNQSGDNQLPTNTADSLSANMGALGGAIAPGNQNNMGSVPGSGSGSGSANYGSPSYGGYLAPELIALKAKLAASQRQKQKALRDRAMYLDDSRRAYGEADRGIAPQYQRRGLGPDTGLITRDRRKLGENQIRSEGRYDIQYGDLIENIAIRDDAARRQAFANAMQRYQADVAARAAMKPNILEAF